MNHPEDRRDAIQAAVLSAFKIDLERPLDTFLDYEKLKDAAEMLKSYKYIIIMVYPPFMKFDWSYLSATECGKILRKFIEISNRNFFFKNQFDLESVYHRSKIARIYTTSYIFKVKSGD